MQNHRSNPFGPQAVSPLWRLGWWVWAVVALVTAVCVFTPLLPRMPTAGLDSSWVVGMNQAVAQKLAFGRQIAFTFGPYAAMFTRTYHPVTDGYILWSSLYLGVSFAVVSLLLLRQAGWIVRALFLVAVLALPYSDDAILYAYPLAAGVYGHQLITGDDRGGRPAPWLPVALAALFFPFGLLPLIKGSLMALSGAVAGLIFLQALIGRRWAPAAAIALSPLLAAALFWLIAGQPLGDLPAYVTSSLPFVSGYTEAMALDGPIDETIEWVTIAGVLLIAVLLTERRRLLQGGSLVLVFCATLFLTFKGGFVRHDGHAVFPSVFLLLAATYVLVVRDAPRWSAAVYLASAFVCCVIVNHYQPLSPASLRNGVKDVYLPAWQGLQARLKGGEPFAADYKAALARVGTDSGFPKLTGTTDIYSYDQAWLIASGEQWDPRPVLQSYAAYSPSLIEMDRRHLIGPDAPENVFFKPAAIDNRLPTLEDGASWPLLLSNYRVTSVVADYLLLHRVADGKGPDLTSLGAVQTHDFGETVAVPPADGAVFAKIDIKPSLMGRVANLLFKTSQLSLTLTLADGEKRQSRIVSGMTSSGFLVSPAVSSTRSLLMLYGNADYLAAQKAKTLIVDTRLFHRFWKRQYRIEFFRLPTPRDPSLASMLQLAKPYVVPAGTVVHEAAMCDGAIDAINGVKPFPDRFQAMVEAVGWVSPSVANGELGDKSFIVLTDQQGRRTFYDTQRRKRPDLVHLFNKPVLDDAGFEVSADISPLKGAATLGLAYQKAGVIEVCPQFKVPATLN